MIYTTQPLTRCMAAALAGVASLVAWPPAGVLADSHAMAPLPRERANPESEPSANSRETSAPEAAAADTAPVETVPVEAAPVEGSAEYASLVLERYASGKGWDTEFVRDGKGNPEALPDNFHRPSIGNNQRPDQRWEYTQSFDPPEPQQFLK